MAHLTKNKRSKIQFSNELVDAMTEEHFDSKRLHVMQRSLQICYELLPKHMQIIAKLRFKEEKNLKEISKLAKRPLGSISATLHRIRQNLVQCVKQKMPGIEAEMDF